MKQSHQEGHLVCEAPKMVSLLFFIKFCSTSSLVVGEPVLYYRLGAYMKKEYPISFSIWLKMNIGWPPSTHVFNNSSF